MKELTFKKSTGQGIVDGVLRVIGRNLYFKYQDSIQTRQILENFRKKGVKVTEGRGWIRVDLIGDNQYFKLGEKEYNQVELTEEQIEEILYNFYLEQYKKMQFIVKEKNDN